MTDERPGARRAPSARPEGWRDRLRRPGTITVVALVLIAVQVAFRTWAVSGSWFYADDYFFLSDVALGRADHLDWYLQVYQGHFMPVSFLLVRLAAAFGAYPWTAVVVEIAVMQLLASLAAWWMLRVVFGNRWAILGPLGLYLFSALTIPSVPWWAVAINQLPHQAAAFGLLGAHVLHVRTRSWRSAVLATAFLVLGLTTYSKSILLAPILVLLSMLLVGHGSPVHRAWESLKAQWRAWLLYAGPVLTFLALYLVNRESGAPTGGSLLELAYNGTVRSFGPALVGGPWRWSELIDGPIVYGDPPSSLVVLGWLVLVGTAAVAVLRRERAWQPLLLLPVYLLMTWFFIYVGRTFLVTFLGGRYVGQSVQYVADSAPLTVLVAGLMWMTVPGVPGSSRARRVPLLTRTPSRLLVVPLVVVLTAGAVFSSVLSLRTWHSDFYQRAFTERALETITQPNARIADADVPPTVVPPIAGSRGLIREYFAPLGENLTLHRAGTDLDLLDADGNLAPARVIDEPRSARTPERCAYETSSGEPLTIPIVPVIDSTFWMQVDYSTLVPGDVAVVAGRQRIGVRVESGEHRLLVRTTGAYDEVTIWPAERQVLCVSAVRIGNLTAEEDAS